MVLTAAVVFVSSKLRKREDCLRWLDWLSLPSDRMGIESPTENHERDQAGVWLPDTGLGNSVLGWNDHSPKFQMCFFVISQHYMVWPMFPILYKLVTPLH